jgi:hypothetical protein
MAYGNLFFAVAASYVRRLGPKAVTDSEEREIAAMADSEEIAEGIGDTDGAAIWREIAAMADDMLRPRRLAS